MSKHKNYLYLYNLNNTPYIPKKREKKKEQFNLIKQLILNKNKMEKSLNNTLESVSGWINFNYSEWAKIEAHADNAKSIEKASDYLIETMTKATNAEQAIAAEKKKANRISRKKEGYDTYKKPEKANEEGYLSFLYEINTNNESQDFLFYGCIINKEIAQFIIQSGKLKLVPKKLHQGQYYKAWTLNTH